MNKAIKQIIVCAFFLGGFLACANAQAANWHESCSSDNKCYIVDPQLTDNCGNTANAYYNISDRTCTGANQYILGYKTLNTPNDNAVGGDTVYIRGSLSNGRYIVDGSAEGIAPTHAGDSWNKVIRYTKYPGDGEITLYGNSTGTYGIYIFGSFALPKNYIKVDNLSFENIVTNVVIDQGAYNEIAYCTFKEPYLVNTPINNSFGSRFQISIGWGQTTRAVPNEHNWIHDVTAHHAGGFDSSYDYGVVLNVGQETNNGGIAVSSVDPQTDIFTLANNDYASGRLMVIYTTGTPPAPLQKDTLYYLINTANPNGSYTTQFKLASSYENARNGIAIDITDAGSGSFKLSSMAQATDHTTLENLHLYYGGHHVVGLNTSRYSVFRNSTVHNEAWYPYNECANTPSGKCGYRNINMTGEGAAAGRSLLEGIKSIYGGAFGDPHPSGAGASGGGYRIDTPNTIVRYSESYGHALHGFMIGSSISGDCVASLGAPCYTTGVHMYNNTSYYNGWGHEDDMPLAVGFGVGFYFYNTNVCQGEHTVLNNIIYQWHDGQYAGNDECTGTGNPSACCTGNKTGSCGTSKYTSIGWTASPTNSLISHNLNYPASIGGDGKYVQTDPLFANGQIASNASEISTVVPDLRLQAASPAKDAAKYLTTATNSGSNSANLKVDDPWFFQDGTWGSLLTSHANDRCVAAGDPDSWCTGSGTGNYIFQADYICIGVDGSRNADLSNCSQINSIDYDNNAITLETSLSWSSGDNIWLYKKSDGTQVLSGSAPDCGAHEYAESAEPSDTTAPAVPTNLVVE
ncbi:MAG: hypothetical protein PHQ46_09280 [Negativicutes bacterium]|nr:hypothetical protein [Negativicutes bacterium]